MKPDKQTLAKWSAAATQVGTILDDHEVFYISLAIKQMIATSDNHLSISMGARLLEKLNVCSAEAAERELSRLRGQGSKL